MQNLHLLVNQLESNISQFETTNNSVSGGSVGWHIEHSLKTIDQIITACKNSNPLNYQWQFIGSIQILTYCSKQIWRNYDYKKNIY